jgi:3',5'-cyclic AMP phosphodiesterase CpdA
MYRIAHISDLHISDLEPEEKTNLEWFGQILAQLKFKVDVVADKHDEHKLDALKNKFRELRPDLIVVTGDITNYGDLKSFRKAVEILTELKDIAQAKRVICIPGNHDCLAERVAHLRNKSRWDKAFIWFVSKFNRETAMIRQTSFDQKVLDLLETNGLQLLRNYQDIMKKEEYGEVNPSIPVGVPTPWGEIIFFLFNSTNDPGYMANEGRIGQFQYNALNKYLDNPDERERFERAVRVALLHHHPIENPRIDASAVDRGYDAMVDGARLMTYVGRRGFHLILHGHQHVPYMWRMVPDQIPNIAAAGSAIAGSNPNQGSFNIIDLLNPFEAIYRLFEYKPTGYEENVAEERKLEIKSLSNIRITPLGEPERAEDRAIRTLFEGRKEAYDEDHQYDLLEYIVNISSDQLYTAKYHRKGKVVSNKADSGLVFVITGSPEMKLNEMGIRATDVDGNTLHVEAIKDFPNQKVLLVHHFKPLMTGAEFDLTLEFRWQASATEPNDFDGINLMYFKHPVGKLHYQAQLPWQPIDPKVISYAITESDAKIPELNQQADGTYLYSFEIEQPKPLAYLIWFKKGSI